MPATRPFRFGLKLRGAPTPDAWQAQARRAEALGYDTVLLADHVGYPLAPLPGALAAALATSRLKVGTSVLCNDFRHPAILAGEARSIDWLTGGRLELGIGAGWKLEDHAQTGIPRDPAATRIERLEEALIVIRGLFGDAPVSFEGEHYRVEDLPGTPTPPLPDRGERGGPPIHVGGGGRMLLGVAGRHADIVSINPRARTGRHDAEANLDGSASQLDRKLGWLREAAKDRFDQIEIATELHVVAVTEDRARADALLAERYPVPAEEARTVPHGLTGSVDEVCDLLTARRERWGTSYWIVPPAGMEEMAPVIERMAGR